MEFLARYQDGVVADLRDVVCVVDLASQPIMLAIVDAATREELDRWPSPDVMAVHSGARELRLSAMGKAAGARLVVSSIDDIRKARALLPSLQQHHRRYTFRQVRIAGLSTLALLSVIVAYIYGVPLLAGRLVWLIPPEWEEQLGQAAASQIEAALTEGKGFVLCDPDTDSPANRAIARFVGETFNGLGSPFTPRVAVVRSSIPNAFALPGGQAYYLSELLQASQTPEEFAGVLAHELGHVYYRHSMETLIATSATGLLVGFVLGDMTGLSVAGAVGSSLIDNRFSREAERQADEFAAATAQRLGFSPKGLVDLLDRVAKDDEFSRALALFASHPLTEERRKVLEAMEAPIANPRPAFDSVEWAAIRSMCKPPAPPPLPPIVTPAP
ncbi:MAG: M48 family metallopeptidase [Devosia sp.]